MPLRLFAFDEKVKSYEFSKLQAALIVFRHLFRLVGRLLHPLDMVKTGVAEVRV